MDKEEESSCSHQVYIDQSDSNTIGKNWLGNPFDETTYEETSVRKNDLGSISQMIDFNIGIHNKLSMDDGNTWHTGVSFGDLLAMAATGKVGNNSDGVDTQQYGQVDYGPCLSDLNLPPQTVIEPYVSTGLCLGFTPVTPNQGRRAEQHKQVESEIVDSNENERMNLNIAADKEMANLDEHSQADVSTLASVNEDMEKGLTEKTDLNETPQPKQKRRRKHRPKVVKEGQRKRARKPATPKPETPKPGATSTGKRKYVRKKGIEKSTETPTVGEVSGTVDPSTSTNQQTKKTCKRKINFDEPEQQTEVMVEKTQVEHTVDKTTCSTSEVVENFQKVLNSESPSSKPENPKPGATSTRKRKYVRRTRIEKSTETPTVGEVSATVDPSTSTNQQTKKTCNRKINFDEPGQQTEVMVEKTQVEHTVDETTCSTSKVVENFQKVLNSESPSPITPSKAELPRGGSKKSTKATCKINFLQETHDKGESSVPSPNESNCSTSACFNKGKEAQGSKAGFSRNMDRVTLFDGNALGIIDQETYLSMFTNYNSGSNGIQLPVISKKKRIRKKQSGMIATTSASKAPEMPKDNGVYMQNSRKMNTTDFRMAHDPVAFAGMIDGRYQQPTYMEAHATEFQLSLVTEKRSLVPPFYHYQQYFTNHIGSNPSLRCKSTCDVEALIYKFERLNINRQVAEKYRNAVIPYMSGYHEKNALVVFQRDGTLVPYIKKRKTRPKVDLDDETARVWKLLLEDINSEGIDGTDEAKAKWWEEERKVFRGRAESFIARMHLVQGDRRFSKWKGSVLDSVVGVFLTQNVSDHLSSSAFMSLAARYPLKSKRSSGAPHEEESIMSVKEPFQEDEDRGSMMMQNDDPCEEKEIVNSNELSQNSVITFDLNDNSECEVVEITEKDSAVFKESVMDQTEVDDIHSSQDSAHTSPSSVQSSIVHNSERLGSSSVHNSREQKDGSKSTALDGYTSFVEMLHKQGPTNVDETYSQQLAEDSTEQTLSAKEHALPNTCTLEASAFESFEVREGRKVIQAQNKKSASEESRLSAESASQTTVQMVKSISSHESVKSSNTCINCEMQEVVELTNVSAETPKSTQSNNIIEASGETAHKVVKCNLNDNGGSQIVKGINKDSSKVKKQKTGKEQIKVEWDNLRLEAEVKQKRERAPDTMDSLDYEAVRAANVDDVADSIKERGMNNRLAARIKDMLDRLVEDHGSIDLEWLRDVPPDKAKEYLLSFKGLGLKSVECIRLLTLHHLAFPVDTNVGRIAVRLGWVPLQPLPESLQLHLLELYPIMESIQQYLWPRLCKLDQRTLYELHYQMITFGKVFCTKTKPNCNACPLRGECRHFASAFASARLGLPAPEGSVNGTGQSTVGMIDQPSTSINRTAQSPVGMIDLPPASNQLQQLSEAQNCNSGNKETETPGPIVELPATPGPIVEVPASPEPIIEVPATPEPEQIQQELDIEDFCEDPEEIPMIKLNIEQFTQNLQTFMERHMELGEGDMSKALVALTSEAASIPTPKLKNVSQLRTEHQVYELPDSHPLLEGLDTREPDDPCSYLLAIWTPGETADSIQPPEGQCCSQESGMLCNEETCFFCNSTREANSQTVRGTLLIPCRTAMRGSFPLNGTYFQVNEVFADHASSLNPIAVPRSWLWNLPRRTVYFGTSIPTIFKGMTTEAIQYCFWRGFVCVRGFDQKTRAPRPLMARLHFPVSHLKRYKAMLEEKEKLKQ